MSSSVNAPIPIRLLILSNSADQSEQITTSLRNGGLAVHSTRFTHPENLDDQLDTNTFDILLYGLDDQAHLPLIFETISESGCDLPLLLLSDQGVEPSELLQAMRNGARDLVEKEDLEHLQLVVAREFDSLQQRRELTALRRRLKETEQRCMGLIESSREAIAFIQDGMLLHVNPAYLELFGFANRDDIADLPLLDMIDKSYHKELKRTLRRLDSDSEKQSVTIDILYRRQKGDTCDGSIYIAKARMDGEPCLQIIIRKADQSSKEIEQKKQAPEHLDTDLQLPSRQYFLSKLDTWAENAASDSELRALLYISIDQYSELRTSLDSAHTDALVKSTAGLIKSQILPNDVLARFNDNTFTLLCRRPSADAIDRFAEDIRLKIATLSLPEYASSKHPSCSVGIAFMAGPITEGPTLINDAYNACETARHEGGNCVALASADRSNEHIDSHDIKVLEQISYALKKERFVLAYQPIVSLQGDTRENYAVLVRMLGDGDEELLPEQFIKQAERHEKMIDIDRWIIRNSIAALAEQRKEGRKVNFFISLSVQALREKNLLLWICDCLREFDARGGWLTFQIREKHVRDNLRTVSKLIEGLKKIKCQIALDHFGLLAKPDILLNHIKVDFVKLAPNLVSDINSDQEKQDILNNLNEMVVANGVKTIAMAVEDANSLTVLWTVGIGYIQGYFLQEPSRTIEYGAQQLL